MTPNDILYAPLNPPIVAPPIYQTSFPPLFTQAERTVLLETLRNMNAGRFYNQLFVKLATHAPIGIYERITCRTILSAAQPMRSRLIE